MHLKSVITYSKIIFIGIETGLVDMSAKNVGWDCAVVAVFDPIFKSLFARGRKL